MDSYSPHWGRALVAEFQDEIVTRQWANERQHHAAAICPSRSGVFSARDLLGSSRLGALLSPEETLKELDMGARGRLQGKVRT